MFKHVVIFLFLISWVEGNSQTYGNEWINYNQKYLSFKVIPSSTSGNSFGSTNRELSRIYLIDYATLTSALTSIGESLSFIPSSNFQVFGKEEEVPLYINDGGDNMIGPGDYIMLVASYNDGWLDSTLYQDPSDQGNPYYSLYNDTIQYFLTWNSGAGHFRFEETNFTNYNDYNAEPYILYDHWLSNVGFYSDGLRTSSTSSSFFTPGEGWSTDRKGISDPSPYFNYTSQVIAHPYQGVGAPDVLFKSLQIGASDFGTTPAGLPNHSAKWTIGPANTIITQTTWEGYTPIFVDTTFPVSILPSSGTSNFKISLTNLPGVTTDYQRSSTWSFKYPRIPNFDGNDYFEFDIKNSPTDNTVRIDVTNITYSNPLVFVLGNSPKKVNFFPNGGAYTMLIPDDFLGGEQHVVYHDSSNVVAVSSLVPVGDGGSGFFTDYSTFDFEASLLMIYHPKFKIASEDYHDYRSLEYNAILANVNELYQQFGGGIEKHINGIRRFAHFAYNNSTEKPIGLFLMGKGIREVDYNEELADGSGTRKHSNHFANSYIPSFGEPSSDVFITARLEGNNWDPLIPTGRIAAKTVLELSNYLQKVVEFEAEQDSNAVYNSATKDWQKQVVHFSGGVTTGQMDQFAIYVNQFKSIIEGSLYAANVTTLNKSFTNPITPTQLNDIMDRINSGTSLITYFGHSLTTSSGFEINIDEVSNWENSGKYPVMLVNSCYNGNVFQVTTSNSEEFVNEPNKGAIAYIGSVRQGFEYDLKKYSEEWYRQVSLDNYGASLGEQMRATISERQGSNNLNNETACSQMVLNGDPMLRVNPHNHPEIELTPEYISFTPNDLTVGVDSIEMHIYIKNLGRSITDTISIEVTRNFPGSSDDSIYLLFLPKLDYDATVNFKMPIQEGISAGINQFTVRADIPSVYQEQFDESFNNQVAKALIINISGIAPVIPYEFAVVPDPKVTLYASTFDPIAPLKTYRFEIDTIDFEGPPSLFHRYAQVTEYGGVEEVHYDDWTLSSSNNPDSLICADSTVYFWRVVEDGDTNWRESSFQYIQGKTGWGQDHFYQFKNNSFYGLDYDRPSRLRNLVPYTKILSCDAYSTTSNPGYLDNAWYLNGQQRSYGICNTSRKFHVVVIDPTALDPWYTRNTSLGVNLQNDFGNENDEGSCHAVMDFFTFPQENAVYLDSFLNMINNKVPDSAYLLIYSPMSTKWGAMQALDSAGIFGTFASLGSTMAVSGQVEGPMAFFCKKGDPSTVVESFATFPTQNIHLDAILYASGIGIEKAPLIGPSSKWNSVYWKQDPLEVLPNGDSVLLTIHAYDINQVWQSKIDTAFTLNDSILNLDGMIDANTYPYISLEATMFDTISITAAQIDRWHVLFDPLPEAAIDGHTLHYWSAADTINEGEEIYFAVDVRNIFTIDMDSLLVNYWLTDEDQNVTAIAYPRQDSLRVGEILRDTLLINTTGLKGWSSFNMEVNPYVNGSIVVTDQPEQLHFNNVLHIPFFVHQDDENPLLDVTFNGRRILNGDIIDPNSEILMTLKDDNEFLIMDSPADTANFGIYLTDPNGVQKKIPFVDGVGNIVMEWIPADAQNKRFKILWPAAFTQNGEYQLTVQGEDKSGNLSGDIEYKVSFNIILESTITQMMNYPNPFSTSTRFVFTLTGSEVPDDIIIQIMTVSGRVVREITEGELGPLQIGRNITEYAWDGTDEFGDPLANGVYLYRVKARINGEDIKRLDSGADKYFTKEFGKMYILR